MSPISGLLDPEARATLDAVLAKSAGKGFVAPAELLNETFSTRILEYRATVHLPSASVGEKLAPPRTGPASSGEPSEEWGWFICGGAGTHLVSL
jgi:hypothetical protein